MYLRQPTSQNWQSTTSVLRNILVTADSILSRLNTEKSDLVLQPAYVKLQTALQARVSLLSQLTALPPPTSKAELAELRNVLARYRLLVAQLEAARDELNEYVRQSTDSR
jgi:hypothetical protein